MKINKTELKKALETVKPGLANKDLIEQSTSFAFMKNKVVTYNDEISISYPLKTDLTGAIKAEELYQFINRVKTDEIDIEQKENQLILKSGRSKAGLILESDIKLPLEEIGKLGKFEALPEDFTEALKFVHTSTSTDMSRPVLTCVNIKSNLVQASDNYRIVKWEFESEIGVKEFLIQTSIVKELTKLNPVKIAEGKGWIHFATGEKAIISCRIFEDEYPEVSQFFDIEGVSLTLPNTTSEILDRAIIFSKRETQLEETISVLIKNNRIKISAKAEHGSWFEEEANIQYKDEPISFLITPYLLHDILKETHSFIMNETKIRFEGNKWMYVASLLEKSE